MDKYVVGLDFGTDSVRALIVDPLTGKEAGSGISYYKRWKNNAFCDEMRNCFRQHPLDYIESLEEAVKEALAYSPGIASKIAGLSVDTTGSTPVAVDKTGTPLALLPGFENNPNAMFILWKDHTAVTEAEEINQLAANWGGPDYTKYSGGIYSSEWFWAKILNVLRNDHKVREAAFSWLEHCDWIPALLTGVRDVFAIKRSRCAAGHKAMWHEEWDGLPSDEFLIKLDPLLAGLRERLYTNTYTSDQEFGVISQHWANRLGLPENVVIGVGAFDAHLGAVGGEIKPFYLSKVMGTSTCDMVVIPEESIEDKLIKGICGQVEGSIIPGMIGLEAGQSGFGDIFAWFRELLIWPIRYSTSITGSMQEEERSKLENLLTESLLSELSEAALEIDPEESGVIALDWLNGRRTPDSNHSLKGAIAGITIGTSAPALFRALVEGAAFGSKKIVERFRDEGIRIDGIIALGGIPKKSPFIMQIVTDVLNMPIQVARHEQACALGSAMAASVAARINPDFLSAQKNMGHGFEKTYYPRESFVKKYHRLYEKYCSLGNKIEQFEQ